MSFCFCRLAIWRSKKNCIHSPVRLNRSKNIASVHPFDFTVRKNCICSPVRLYRSKKCCSRSTDVSNGLSSRLLSVRLPCVRPFERIMPFVHSPKGKALVLAVHSRETRNFSRETRLVSRETRRVSRDGGNLHLSGTVCLAILVFVNVFSISYHCFYAWKSLGLVINPKLLTALFLFSLSLLWKPREYGNRLFGAQNAHIPTT